MTNGCKLIVKELQHKIQRAIEIYTVNPTGPAAHLMHKALIEGSP